MHHFSVNCMAHKQLIDAHQSLTLAKDNSKQRHVRAIRSDILTRHIGTHCSEYVYIQVICTVYTAHGLQLKTA